MAPPVDVVGPRPRLGEVEAPPRSRSSLSPKVEVESEPPGRTRWRPSADARAESEHWGWAKRSSSSSGAEPKSEPWGRAERSSPSSGAEPKSEPWGRAERSSPSSGAEPESEPWGWAERSSSSSGAEPESEPWGRAERSSPSSRAEPESEPWGRAKRSFLWRLRPDLAAVSLTLLSGTAVGAAQATLSSCLTGQWSGKVTTVTLALSTGACVRIKVLGHLCIKCPCDLVGWRGELAKVASR
jgi:hypothetical protein